MENVNPDVIVFGIFLSVLILVGLIGGVFYLFSEGRQVTKARLERVQDRYSRSVAPGKSAARRAFQSAADITTIENILRQMLPKPDLLRLRLARTGRRITLAHYSAMVLISGLIAFFLLWFLMGVPTLLAIFLSILAGIGLPHLVVAAMIKKRIAAFIALFPDALDLIVRGLRSGLPITESINSVCREIDDPVRTEFRKVMDQIRLGREMDTALNDVARRIDAPEFKFFIISLAIQRETGGNLAETLAKLSDLLRRRQQMKLKIRAMASEGKASAYIVGALPFVMFALLLVINYDYTSVLFTDTRAIIASVIGLVWMSIGGFIMSRMVSFEI